MGPSTALLTDHYELTMLAAALRTGVAHRRAAFEVFGRRLPDGRRYGVVGGLGRFLDALEDLRFGDDELAFLETTGFDRATLDWLGAYRFAGDVVAYREGELWFPHSPILAVEATFGEAVILETLALSILNPDSAVAAAAARMVGVADGRPLLEMGGRRTHEEAAVAAARIAHLLGFAATSNLEAGRRYGVPTGGTAAHAFTLAHRTEEEAFASQLDAGGVGTTLLVDTYDIAAAIRTAVRLANDRGATGPGAIRIDSGDLAVEATKARALLDELGATATRISVSSDLDEYLIEDLIERRAPIDGFGVGTRLVTGSGHPTVGFVYKLVAIAEEDRAEAPLHPVAKRSSGKRSVGGRKRAWRILDAEGLAVEERVVAEPADQSAPPGGRPLQVPVIRGGERVHSPTNAEITAHHRAAMAELRVLDRSIVAGPAALSAAPAEERR
jgi:nicotinate phosphoribosyltransferase